MEDSCLRLIEITASEIVKVVLDNAEKVLRETLQTENGSTYEIKNIRWITCENFTIDTGIKQIKDYISTWEMHSSWLYSLKFLEIKDTECYKEYHYRCQWSIPTRRTPIPRATASVYFVIHVSKLEPQNLPIDVYYLVESNQLIHRPGKTRFREKWLKDVIESKILLQSTVSF